MSPRFVKLSRHTALFLNALVGDKERTGDWRADAQRCVDELRAALKPQPIKKYVKKAQARKTARKATKKEQTKAIREAVARRADGNCEACGAELFELEMDHFFGRVRVPQSVRNCWLICYHCHRNKTENLPSAAYWLEKFIAHANQHSYLDAGGEASRRLDSLQILPKAVGR